MSEQGQLDNADPTVPPAKPSAAAAPPADLSAEIAAALDRNPGDLIKITRVGGATYRCNWWAAQPTGGYDNPSVRGPTYGTHLIRQSRFVRATQTPRGLVITDVKTEGDARR